ncbi:MAG TPA: glycosyltransferase [Acidobacteriaceae bacterium]|jgi:glycosyltransferase involved in cell wall biosynthesis|nr:glycosyltransferase [Acidobacteriaceae bacterium]
MRVSLAVFGVFHHFELAHQLRQHGYLQTVYSTFPWFRLQREGLPHEHVETFPWFHTGMAALARYGMYPSRWTEDLDWWNGLAFDAWIKRRIPPTDALIAISGAAVDTGRMLQSRGGKYICDRGSTHARFQGRTVSEEFRNWGQEIVTHDSRDTEREEQQYALADCITVPSHFAARSFVAQGLPAEKIRVIPYGVRLDSFHPQGEPAREEFNVIFAGQIGLRKGVPYLLEAFARLRHPHKRLRMVGALQSEMRPLLSRLPLDQVEFLGVVSRSQLADYLSTSNVLVLPSIEEGLALVQGEAMACGCPVIATPNSGSEDLFADGKEGFIVPARDAQAVTDRLQQLADDRSLQQQMRAAALQRVQHLGGWKDYGDRWVDLLDELCG